MWLFESCWKDEKRPRIAHLKHSQGEILTKFVQMCVTTWWLCWKASKWRSRLNCWTMEEKPWALEAAKGKIFIFDNHLNRWWPTSNIDKMGKSFYLFLSLRSHHSFYCPLLYLSIFLSFYLSFLYLSIFLSFYLSLLTISLFIYLYLSLSC